MPAPAPAGPYPSALSTFDGGDPNGNWLLYIADDQGGGNGFIINNPTLTIQTMDVTPPETTITKKPKTGFKAQWRRSSSSRTSLVRRSSARWTPRSSSRAARLKLKKLKFGKHKFQVRAIDAAGNVTRARHGRSG